MYKSLSFFSEGLFILSAKFTFCTCAIAAFSMSSTREVATARAQHGLCVWPAK